LHPETLKSQLVSHRAY